MSEHPRDRERHWVLKSERQDFFLCAAGGDPRAALCIFDSKEAAEDHRQSLSEPKMYFDTLERYGAGMPDWMSEEPLLPKPREVFSEDLREILAATGIEYVAVSSEEEPETLEVFPAEEFFQRETE